MRGTTTFYALCMLLHGDFNPRPPVRGTTKGEKVAYSDIIISIHVPLCGGRPFQACNGSDPLLFQSTSPCAGDDAAKGSITQSHTDFNPRPPVRGTTTIPSSHRHSSRNFNPRPPVRGTTLLIARASPYTLYFNPRPPVRGTTSRRVEGARFTSYFNPRPPVRGTTYGRHVFART